MIAVVLFKHKFKCFAKSEFMLVPSSGTAGIALLRGADSDHSGCRHMTVSSAGLISTC